MLDEVGKDIGPGRQITIKEGLYMSGVKTIVNHIVVEIKCYVVVIEKDGVQKEIPSGTVVMAVGSKPNKFDDLQAACKKTPHPLPHHWRRRESAPRH